MVLICDVVLIYRLKCGVSVSTNLDHVSGVGLQVVSCLRAVSWACPCGAYRGLGRRESVLRHVAGSRRSSWAAYLHVGIS